MRASALVPARMAAIVVAPVLVLPLVLAFVVPLVVAVARLAARGAIAVVVVLVAVPARVAARLGRAVAGAVLLVLLVAAAVRVVVLRAALLRIRHVRLAVRLVGARSALARGVVFAVLLALLGAARALAAGRVLVLRAALGGVGASVAGALLRRALVIVAEDLRALVTRAELRAVLHALLLDARVPAVRRDDSWGLRHSDLGECNSYSAREGGRYKLHGLPPDFRKCPHRAGGTQKTQGPFLPKAQFRDSKLRSTSAYVRYRTEGAPACRDHACDGDLLLGGGRGAARLDELRVSGLQRSARPRGFDCDRGRRRAGGGEGGRADVRHHRGAARRLEHALPHVRGRDRGRVSRARQSSLPPLGHLRPRVFTP